MTTDKPTGAEITEAAMELGIDLDGADMDIYHATALENFGVYAEIDAEDDDPGLAFRDGNRDWAERVLGRLGPVPVSVAAMLARFVRRHAGEVDVVPQHDRLARPAAPRCSSGC